MRQLNFTLLFVDNTQSIHTLVSPVLARRVEKVYYAMSGSEAMDIFEEHKIDAIITDIEMPEMTGIELARLIHKTDPYLPIAAYSSSSDLSHRLNTAKEGFIDHVEKSLISASEISITLERLNNIVVVNKSREFKESKINEFRSIIDNAALVSILELDGTFSHVNDAFVKASGYIKEDFEGATHKLIHNPKNSSKQMGVLWKTLLSGDVYRGVVVNKTKQGSDYYIDYVITPLKDEEDKTHAYMAIGHDITKSMNKNKWLSSIIDAVPMKLMITDGSKVLLVNQAIKEFFDIKTKKEFLKSHPSIYDLFNLNKDECSFEGVTLDSLKDNKITFINKLTQQEHVFIVHATRLGTTEKRLVLLGDISSEEEERRKLLKDVEAAQYQVEESHKNLRLREERFNLALDSSRDGFFEFNLETDRLYLSDGWKKRLGFEVKAIITYADYTDLINDNQKDAQDEELFKLIEKVEESKKSEQFSSKYKVTTKQGESIDIESVGEIFCDETGEVTRIAGFHRDISSSIAQEKLITSQSRLAALGEMLNNIAHQWRQPIAAINNVINDVEFEIELDELEVLPADRIMGCTKEIQSYTSHLSKTIDDFRKFSKNEINKKEFDLVESINETLGLIELTLAQASITVHTVLSDNGTVFGHQRELTQVILNIINNAKDAMLEMFSDPKEIFINVTKVDKDMVITIEDTAGGIAPHVIEKIFDPYFTTKDESIGTGIGLYMSKKIIEEQFNGKITISNSDKGALFSIILPCTESTS